MDELTSKQISEWGAYDKLEPIGQYRNDVMIATLCAQVSNFMQSFGKGKGRKPAEPKDFIPWWISEEKQAEEEAIQSEDEVKERILRVFGIPMDKNKEDS